MRTREREQHQSATEVYEFSFSCSYRSIFQSRSVRVQSKRSLWHSVARPSTTKFSSRATQTELVSTEIHTSFMSHHCPFPLSIHIICQAAPKSHSTLNSHGAWLSALTRSTSVLDTSLLKGQFAENGCP